MKALVLGGAGEVGQHIVKVAARSATLSQVVIGERDIARAEVLAKDCGTKVCARELDVADSESLATALADCDVVVSCIGPYYKFGTHVLSAAIRAHRHYLDVCDDWEPTLDMLTLDAQARTAGVSALLGMGASPGVSNLLAVAAHAALDRVDVLHTCWGIGDLDASQEDENTSAAALEHWLLQTTGLIRARRDRQMVDEKPLQEHVLSFPGFGSVRCYSLGHPEPVTLPLTFPEIRDSQNLMNLPEATIGALRRTASELDAGEIEMSEAVLRLQKRLGEGSGPSTIVASLHFLYSVFRDSVKGVKYLPEVCALSIGEKDGIAARAGAWLNGYLPGGTGGATGIPAAVALEMLACGEIDRRGVFAPEAGVNAKTFFQRLQDLAIRSKTVAQKPFLDVLVEPIE